MQNDYVVKSYEQPDTEPNSISDAFHSSSRIHGGESLLVLFALDQLNSIPYAIFRSLDIAIQFGLIGRHLTKDRPNAAEPQSYQPDA
jgi:hypothetical protein